MNMSVENIVANLIVEKLQPDFTALREEIATHKFMYMRLNLDTAIVAPKFAKVLFTTSESAVVQEVELTCGRTRFMTYNIAFGEEWEKKFVNWIDPDNDSYEVISDCWQCGMRMYSD